MKVDEATKAFVATTINQLLTKGGMDNFAIFNLNSDYYIQMSAQPNTDQMYCEAVSNTFIKSSNTLSESQMNDLLTLGWEAPVDNGNYSLMYDINSDADTYMLAELICKTVDKVYFRSSFGKSQLTLNLE